MSSGAAQPPFFASLVLRLSALANAWVGIAFLVAPARVGALIDLQVASPTADNDLRAVHGGVSSALAIFFWVASSRPQWLRPALCVQLLSFGGLAFGRFVSWAVAGLPGPIAYALHGAEGVGLVAGALALRSLRAEGEPR